MFYMILKRGISRTVLLVGSWAIKVPTTRPYGGRKRRLWAWTRGYQANVSELQWSCIEGVAPVIWHIGNIVVCFRRCEPFIGNTMFIKWNKIAPQLTYGDRKINNIGRLNGELVWLDYDGSWKNECPIH